MCASESALVRQISESLGFSRTTLTNWLSGQLRDTEGRVAEAVAEWIGEQGEEPADWEVIGPAQEEKGQRGPPLGGDGASKS